MLLHRLVVVPRVVVGLASTIAAAAASVLLLLVATSAHEGLVILTTSAAASTEVASHLASTGTSAVAVVLTAAVGAAVVAHAALSLAHLLLLAAVLGEADCDAFLGALEAVSFELFLGTGGVLLVVVVDEGDLLVVFVASHANLDEPIHIGKKRLKLLFLHSRRNVANVQANHSYYYKVVKSKNPILEEDLI